MKYRIVEKYWNRFIVERLIRIEYHYEINLTYPYIHRVPREVWHQVDTYFRDKLSCENYILAQIDAAKRFPRIIQEYE